MRGDVDRSLPPKLPEWVTVVLITLTLSALVALIARCLW